MPSPGQPIITLLREDVKKTLSRIATVAGYNSDVTDVDSPAPEGNRFEPFRCEVQTIGNDWTTEGYAHGRDENNWNFQVIADLIIEEGGDIDAAGEAIAGDIRTALLEDITRGDLAIFTKLTGWRFRDDGKAGLVVAGYCYYQTNLGSTNEQ